MGQVVAPDGVFKGGGNMLLTYNGIKGLRSVFTGGNNKFIHVTFGISLLGVRDKCKYLANAIAHRARFFIPRV